MALFVAACGVGTVVWLVPPGREQPPVAFAEPRKRAEWNPGSHGAAEARDHLLRQARVWTETDPSSFDFAGNPADSSGALTASIVRCQYFSSPAHGTTAKFDCVLPDGEVIKVKYGHTGEIHAEIAAARLLTALGFGADRMYLIPHLRCYGCLRNPFYAVWALDYVRVRDVVARSIPEDRFTDFESVAIERRFEGTEVATDSVDGWAWYELDAVDPSSGANRAERDALRLAAMVLAHWDNKSENQRLIVRPEPFAYIHDLGATFGPNKLDLEGWRATPVWSDRAHCVVSMKALPYSGGTFPDARISEAGRRLLVRQLAAVSDDQLRALFTAARFSEFFDGQGEAGNVNAWVSAFREKARQIAEAGPCE